MEGPMVAFDRIAETAESAGDRLCKDSEVDEIPVRGKLDRSQPGEERHVNEAPQPENSIAHALLDGVYADRAIEALERNLPEVAKREFFPDAKLRHDVRDERLLRVGVRAEPCRQMHGGPVEIAMRLDWFARGGADPHRYGRIVPRAMLR